MDIDVVVEEARQRVKSRKALPSFQVCRQIREAAGLTRKEVAEAIGVSIASLAKYETGRRSPRPAVAPRYAELLRRLSALEIG
jgi:transcriptional regulator with XRE-family HTH domain